MIGHTRVTVKKITPLVTEDEEGGAGLMSARDRAGIATTMKTLNLCPSLT
jgi:hypothetical protein